MRWWGLLIAVALLAGCSEPTTPAIPLPGHCVDGLCALPPADAMVVPLYETVSQMQALTAADGHVAWFAGKWYGLDVETRVVHTLEGYAIPNPVMHGWRVAGVVDNVIHIVDLARGETWEVQFEVEGQLHLLDFNATHYLVMETPLQDYHADPVISLVDDNVTAIAWTERFASVWGHLDPLSIAHTGVQLNVDDELRDVQPERAFYAEGWAFGLKDGTGLIWPSGKLLYQPVGISNGTYVQAAWNYNSLQLLAGDQSQQFLASQAPHTFVTTANRTFAILPGPMDVLVEIRA